MIARWWLSVRWAKFILDRVTKPKDPRHNIKTQDLSMPHLKLDWQANWKTKSLK